MNFIALYEAIKITNRRAIELKMWSFRASKIISRIIKELYEMDKGRPLLTQERSGKEGKHTKRERVNCEKDEAGMSTL